MAAFGLQVHTLPRGKEHSERTLFDARGQQPGGPGPTRLLFSGFSTLIGDGLARPGIRYLSASKVGPGIQSVPILDLVGYIDIRGSELPAIDSRVKVNWGNLFEPNSAGHEWSDLTAVVGTLYERTKLPVALVLKSGQVTGIQTVYFPEEIVKRRSELSTESLMQYWIG